MSEEIILNRIEKEVKKQEDYLDYCKEQLKYLSHEEDTKYVKQKSKETENILYILRKLKKYKNVPLTKNYITGGQQ